MTERQIFLTFCKEFFPLFFFFFSSGVIISISIHLVFGIGDMSEWFPWTLPLPLHLISAASNGYVSFAGKKASK